MTFQHLMTELKQFWTKVTCVIFLKTLVWFPLPSHMSSEQQYCSRWRFTNRTCCFTSRIYERHSDPYGRSNGPPSCPVWVTPERVRESLLPHAFPKEQPWPSDGNVALTSRAEYDGFSTSKQAVNGKRNRFSRNGLPLVIRIYQPQFLMLIFINWKTILVAVVGCSGQESISDNKWNQSNNMTACDSFALGSSSGYMECYCTNVECNACT
jgi:hypothetical protein